MSKPEADPVIEGYNKCFGKCFKRDETIDYMKKMHNEPEDRAGTMFDRMLNLESVKGSDYLEQAEKCAVERRRRRTKNEKKRMKKEENNERLQQILSANSLQLVERLKPKEKKMLGFFVSKDFSNETSYTVQGIHEPSCNCHCFSCYYQKTISLSSLPQQDQDVIERILEEQTLDEDSVA